MTTTAKIPKEEVRVTIYTASQRIEGVYFKGSPGRILDDLNTRGGFIPITRVRVTNLFDEHAEPCIYSFLAINTHHIVFLATSDGGQATIVRASGPGR